MKKTKNIFFYLSCMTLLLVLFQNFTFQVPHNVASNDVKKMGAVGDGITDDTEAIQNALDLAGTIIFPAGTFIVKPLFVRSNTTIVFDRHTVLMAQTGFKRLDSLLNINNVSNIKIYGNGGTIKMAKHEYVAQEGRITYNYTLTDCTKEQLAVGDSNCRPFHSEWRHGVSILTSSNVFIQNLTSRDSGGDGFSVGGKNSLTPNPSTHIYLKDLVADNNFRNGLAIINCQGCAVVGGVFKNTNGSNPQFGIDLEPNPGFPQYLSDINLVNVRTEGNIGGGLSLVMTESVNEVSIKVKNFTSTNDGRRGGIFFANGHVDNSQPGHIEVENARILFPSGPGVNFLRWGLNAPRVKLKDVKVRNPGMKELASQRYTAGFLIEIAKKAKEGAGNIQFMDCSATDGRIPAAMLTPFLFWNGSSNYFMENISVTNAVGGNWTAQTFVPALIRGKYKQVDFSYLNPPVIPMMSMAIDTTFNGSILTNEHPLGRAPKITLPSLGSGVVSSGFTVTFKVTKSGGNIWILPNGADTIQGFSGAAGIVAHNSGSSITLTSIGTNQWQVTNIQGDWKNIK